MNGHNAIPGAIGYAEANLAEVDEGSIYPDIDEIQLAGRGPSGEAVKSGQYPFWAVEYLYTYDKPAAGSLLSAFIDFTRTDAAASILLNLEDIPCGLTPLCG